LKPRIKEHNTVNVLLINGSPHKEGCTYVALSEITKTLNAGGIETEIFWIGGKPVGGCMGCMSCFRTGVCAINDVVNEFREKAKGADGFVFGSPVHYGSASGNMTSFMDRLFYADLAGNNNKTFYMKPAAAIVSARRAGTTAAFEQMTKHFALHEMPIVSSRYWNMVHGGMPQEVLKDEEGLSIMRVLGRNMAYLLRCMEAAKNVGVTFPEQEPRVFTNFIR
jgi:multimeric flavodoxin WrbA